MRTYIYYHPYDKTMNSDDMVKVAFFQYLKELGDEGAIEPPEIGCKKEHGKPYFINYPEIYFNVSHSGDYWSCVFGSVENGLDLQKTEKKDQMRIAKRFFHPLEQQYLLQCMERDPKEGEKEFYRLWTYNESYVKYKGDGLSKGLSYFSVVDEEGKLGVKDIYQKELSFPVDGYYIVVTEVRPPFEIVMKYLKYSYEQ